MTPQARFLHLVENNLAYWQAQVQEMDEPMYAALDPEKANLFQAVRQGLAFPQTCPPATRLATRLIGYIEARGEWRSWLPILEQAQNILGQLDPVTHAALLSTLLNRLGYFHRHEGHLTEARACHEAALAQARQAQTRFEEAVAHFGLGELHFYAFQWLEAEKHCWAGLALLDENRGVEPAVAMQNGLGYNLLGLVAMRQGASPQAVQHFETAIQQWPVGVQPRKLAYCYLNLSTVLREQKEYTQAHTALETCLRLLAQTTSRLAQCEAELALGTLWFEQGDWEAARQVFARIDTRYLEQGGHWSTRAYVANNLGNVALKVAAFEQANDHLAYAIELWRKVGDEVMLGNSLGDLAVCAHHLGQPESARQALDEALRLLSRYPNHAWACARRDELFTLVPVLEKETSR